MVTAVLGLGFRASGLAGHLKLSSRRLPSICKTFGGELGWGRCNLRSRLWAQAPGFRASGKHFRVSGLGRKVTGLRVPKLGAFKSSLHLRSPHAKALQEMTDKFPETKWVVSQN